MPRPFDAAMKHLVEAYPSAWLEYLGLPNPPDFTRQLLRGVRQINHPRLKAGGLALTTESRCGRLKSRGRSAG